MNDQIVESRGHFGQEPAAPRLPVDQPVRNAFARRLVFFVGGLLLVFVGLESLVRVNSSLFEAVADYGRTKVAMFAKHPRAQFLMLGSSRTEETVSPILVTRAIRNIAPELEDVSGFNAAFAGSNLNSLIALAPQFDFSNNLRIVVIEVSEPQIYTPPPPREEPKSAATSIEDELAEANRHIHLVRYRKAFLSDKLGRMIALLFFAPRLSGWETKAKDMIASLRGREEQSAVDFDEIVWTPELFSPSSVPQTLDAHHESIVARIVSVAHEFQKRGIKVVFAVPPVKRDFRAPEKVTMKPLFSEVARRVNSELWNFSPLPLPDSFFRDESHLGDIGRAHYSQALATQIARVLKTE